MLKQAQRFINYTLAVLGAFAFCMFRGINPGVLINLNPGISGGKCTFSKYTMQKYLKAAPFPKTIQLKGSINTQLQQLKEHFGKEIIVLKPEQGIRSIGFCIVKPKQRKAVLETVQGYNYIAQEFCTKPLEVGIFLVRRQKLEIAGIALLDTTQQQYKTSERHDENYFSKENLITPALTRYVNKVFPKNFYYGRIDARIQAESDLQRGRNITFLEVNAGPDASPLHLLDKKYTSWQQMRTHYTLLREAILIAKQNKGTAINFFKYIQYLAKEQRMLRKLKKEMAQP